MCTIFLLFFVPCFPLFFLIFSFLIPVWLEYFLRVPSSVQYQELLYANSLGGGV